MLGGSVTVAAEQERIKHIFDRVEEVEAIAGTLGLEDSRRVRLLLVVRSELDDCAPIRSRIAAHLLRLSEPTIRAWVKEGVLTPAAGGERRLTLDPHRLHDVMHLINDLRHAGRTKGLLEAVWYRLSDRALLEREDLVESIEQMKRAEGREVDPGELRSRWS
jgi:DNA-binding transcriptional MerR regulator